MRVHGTAGADCTWYYHMNMPKHIIVIVCSHVPGYRCLHAEHNMLHTAVTLFGSAALNVRYTRCRYSVHVCGASMFFFSLRNADRDPRMVATSEPLSLCARLKRDLQWSSHVHHVCKKALTLVHLIQRMHGQIHAHSLTHTSILYCLFLQVLHSQS